MRAINRGFQLECHTRSQSDPFKTRIIRFKKVQNDSKWFKMIKQRQNAWRKLFKHNIDLEFANSSSGPWAPMDGKLLSFKHWAPNYGPLNFGDPKLSSELGRHCFSLKGCHRSTRKTGPEAGLGARKLGAKMNHFKWSPLFAKLC